MLNLNASMTGSTFDTFSTFQPESYLPVIPNDMSSSPMPLRSVENLQVGLKKEKPAVKPPEKNFKAAPKKAKKLKPIEGTGLNYKLIEGVVCADKIVFENEESIQEVRRVGAFKIKAPEGLDQRLSQMSAHFFCEKNKINGAIENRPTFGRKLVGSIPQDASFSISKIEMTENEWCTLSGVSDLGEKLNDLAILSLEWSLNALGIPHDQWHLASAGAVHELGIHNLEFSYGHVIGKEKLNFHSSSYSDSSFISVTDALHPGLEIKVGNIFCPVMVEKKYVMVNFGQALETLSQGAPKPISAFKYRNNLHAKTSHRAAKVFIYPSIQGNIQNFDGIKLKPICSALDFFKNADQLALRDTPSPESLPPIIFFAPKYDRFVNSPQLNDRHLTTSAPSIWEYRNDELNSQGLPVAFFGKGHRTA